MDISHENNRGQDALCGANNANNQLNVNGTNGNYSNNTRINGYSVRVALEFNFTDVSSDNFLTYEEWFYIYHETRKNKRNKKSAMSFEIDQFRRLKEIADSVERCEYVPKESIIFMVYYPKKREIIAANFDDRIVQTYLYKRMIPLMESYLSPCSYSCRIGKGGLRAVFALQDIMRSVTKNWKEDAYVFKKDFSGFFMSIDMNLWVRKLVDFIDEKYIGKDKELLKYVSRIIFYSLPQENCIFHTPKSSWKDYPAKKSLIGRENYVGVPIGNITSQMMGNFVTTEYLRWMNAIAGRVAHYTDDTAGCVKNKEEFLQSNKYINRHTSELLNLCVNEDKFYFQHWKKGVEFLGFKIKGERILPSDRVRNNLYFKIGKKIENAELYGMRYVLQTKDRLVNTINSYFGLIRWANSYRMRKDVAEIIMKSPYSSIFQFDENYFKVSVKKEFLTENFYIKKAIKTKKSLLNYNIV